MIISERSNTIKKEIIRRSINRTDFQSINYPSKSSILYLLSLWKIEQPDSIRLIDSSLDNNDTRLNYIIDEKYVLRFSSAFKPTNEIVSGLNRLINRYRACNLQVPSYLDNDGVFLREWNSYSVSLSQYIDLPVAGHISLNNPYMLMNELLSFIARFMEDYRNIDLLELYGKDSLFRLNYLDYSHGVDEKQYNLNLLCKKLEDLKEHDLAERLARKNMLIRAEIIKSLSGLPCCVTQGDEHFSNILVDNNQHFKGLFDFNLAGTDVIMNIIANHSFWMPEPVNNSSLFLQNLSRMINLYRNNAKLMLSYYNASEIELQVLPLYAWIVLISSSALMKTYYFMLSDIEYSRKALHFINEISMLTRNDFSII